MSDWFTRRATLACILLVIGCAYMSFKELRYVISGHTVDASLLSAKEVQLRKSEGGMPFPGLRVDYEFEDGDQVRTEMEYVDPEWPIAKGAKTIAIEFIPGTHNSRLKGNDHKGWLWASGIILVLGAGIGALFWKFRDAGKAGGAR
jgi:hypothetical protein